MTEDQVAPFRALGRERVPYYVRWDTGSASGHMVGLCLTDEEAREYGFTDEQIAQRRADWLDNARLLITPWKVRDV